MNNDAPFVVLGLWGFFTAIGWIIWVISTNVRLTKLGKAQAQMQASLLERLGSSQELLAFLQTDTGRRLLEAPPPAPEPYRSPIGRILMSVQAGIILTAVGAAFFATSGTYFGTSASFQILGFLGVCLGAGFLVAAATTYILSKSWGLLDEPAPKRGAARSLAELEK
jgi:hypothetical protein